METTGLNHALLLNLDLEVIAGNVLVLATYSTAAQHAHSFTAEASVLHTL
jgi:hypothetical protein